MSKFSISTETQQTDTEITVSLKVFNSLTCECLVEKVITWKKEDLQTGGDKYLEGQAEELLLVMTFDAAVREIYEKLKETKDV